MKTDSWIEPNCECKLCGSNIIVCQSKRYDYHYYCSQKLCLNHIGEEKADDDELPDFIKVILV